MDDEQLRRKKAFISYIDDNDIKIATYVELILVNQGFIRFKTKENIITLPLHRLLKLKEGLDDNIS